MSSTSGFLQFPGDDDLGCIEKNEIPILHVLAIALEDMKILGALTIFLQKQAIKGVIDFKQEEMLKVFGYAFNRQSFFVEGFVPDFVASAGNPFLIPPFRINLPDP